MGKLSYKDKINIYLKKKKGQSRKSIAREYNIRDSFVMYIFRLIDKHGIDIVKTVKNRTYSKEFKEEAINRVLLNNEPKWSVAIDIGLPSVGMLANWISKYKENGYNIVERKRGRSTMSKITKKKDYENDKEKIKRLEEENLYLKAELEYSKKLRAVVQARKNLQQKKK